jgi:hypothetical protein
MSRPRRRLALWITFGVTLVLTAALGSPLAGDRLGSHGNALLSELISGVRFPQWTLRPASSMSPEILQWLAPMLADIVLAAGVGVFAMVVTAARSRIAALFAGWGLTVVAAAAVGAARVFALMPVNHPGSALYASVGTAITTGLWFGLATGWLNGAVLAFTVRKAPAELAAAESLAITGAAATEVQPVRIWSPSQPDWQETGEMPAVGTPAAHAQAQVQATRAQPWAPAPQPGAGPTQIVPGI